MKFYFDNLSCNNLALPQRILSKVGKVDPDKTSPSLEWTILYHAE